MFSLAAACVAERLAWVAGGDDVDGFDVVPVDDGEVTEVGGVREPFCEDGGGVGVEVGYPSGVRVVDGFDGEV